MINSSIEEFEEFQAYGCDGSETNFGPPQQTFKAATELGWQIIREQASEGVYHKGFKVTRRKYVKVDIYMESEDIMISNMGI